MDKNDKLIEQLILDQESIQNKDLKAAVEDFKREQSEAKRRQLLQHLRIVNSTVQSAVKALREARADEKKWKQRVVGANAAKDQFLKDGDIAAFNKAVNALV